MLSEADLYIRMQLLSYSGLVSSKISIMYTVLGKNAVHVIGDVDQQNDCSVVFTNIFI